MRSSRRVDAGTWLVRMVAVAPLLAAPALSSQESPVPAPPVVEEGERAPLPDAEEPPGEEEDPCTILLPPDAPWIDRARVAMARTLCTSVDRVDRFFGEAGFDERREGTWGRLSVLADWDEVDGLGGKGRLRARYQLPRAKRRLYALVGRGDEAELLQDRGEAFGALPESFRSLAEDEWLVGLGYSPPRARRGNVRLSVGLRLNWPIEPYVKASWGTAQFFGREALGRYRHTVFWRGDDGWGNTGRLDLERLLGDGFLLRWTNSGTWSQATDGASWYSTVTLFQRLGQGKAVAWQLRSEGETDDDVALRLYGIQATLRRNILRPWLFLEVRPSLAWRRDEIDERRRSVMGFAVGLEIALDNETY